MSAVTDAQLDTIISLYQSVQSDLATSGLTVSACLGAVQAALNPTDNPLQAQVALTNMQAQLIALQKAMELIGRFDWSPSLGGDVESFFGPYPEDFGYNQVTAAEAASPTETD